MIVEQSTIFQYDIYTVEATASPVPLNAHFGVREIDVTCSVNGSIFYFSTLPLYRQHSERHRCSAEQKE